MSSSLMVLGTAAAVADPGMVAMHLAVQVGSVLIPRLAVWRVAEATSPTVTQRMVPEHHPPTNLPSEEVPKHESKCDKGANEEDRDGCNGSDEEEEAAGEDGESTEVEVS